MGFRRFFIEKAKEFEGQEVEVKGWVYQKRSSGKIKFLILRDGTGMLQGVLVKGECPDAAFDDFEKLTQESSVTITGRLKVNPRAPGGWEIGVQKLEIVQVAQPYPISPKEHGIEFLMEHRHLWIRSSKQWAALRVRSEIAFAIHEFYRNHGFVHFDAPILTPTSCEGTSNLFSTNYFDEEQAYLTQSGQLYGETGAMAFGKIYTFGPTFRAEKSKTRKHLTEFWMIEPEMAFADLNDVMDLGEAFVESVVQTVVSRCSAELKTLERDLTQLEKIRAPFPRISYDDSLKILEKRGVGIPWGEDFGAPHETALGDEFDKPVFVHHLPAEIKAFYFKQSDTIGGPGVANGKYALGADLIAPYGYGEVIGGGQREESEEILKNRILAHGLKIEDYQWYLDLRRFGSTPHAGFGLGLERTVAWITGVEHIRETTAYPRMIQTLRP